MITVAKPAKEDRDRLRALWKRCVAKTRAVYPPLDRERLERAQPEGPVLLVQGPQPEMALLVDGSTKTVGIAWNGRFVPSDPDTVRRMEGHNPIGLFVAAAGGGAGMPPDTGLVDLDSWNTLPNPAWTCLAANAQARATRPSQVGTEEARRILADCMARWRAGMRDPFVDTTPITHWSDTDAQDAASVALDILLTFHVEPGLYSVESAGPNGDLLSIQDPNAWDSDPRFAAMSTLLRALVDVDRYWGQTWVYNDGARDRESGHRETGVTVGAVHVPATSAHGRLQARLRVVQRLDALPDQGHQVRGLLPNP